MKGSRITLYAKPEHRVLLRWVTLHTGKQSLSEAVLTALSELQDLLARQRSQALEKAHGMWGEDPAVERAFRELEEGWKAWGEQEPES